MSGTDAAKRDLGAGEDQLIEAARQRAFALYRGEHVPHHSCGAALAVTFGVPAGPYQSLRKGGITGERFCGSIRAGELLLGELLGDEDPTGSVTEALRGAMIWYQAQIPSRFDKGESPDYVCNNLTSRLGEFGGPVRKDFCTNLTSEVAALAMEAVLRFAPELADKLDQILKRPVQGRGK